MKFLAEYSHPAQVHKFKHVFIELLSRGHEVLILSRDKDVMIPLLDELELPHVCLSRARSGTAGMALELAQRELLALWHVWRFKPDVVFSAHSVAIAHAGWLLRKPVLIHDDTEFGTLQKKLYLPFASRIVTSTAYMQDLGSRQTRINSIEPLAYLHPGYFEPDTSALDKYGLRRDEPYAVVRFVAWKAAHDVGHAPPTRKQQEQVLAGLFALGIKKIVITVENGQSLHSPATLIQPDPADLHQLMAFASFSAGDGITVANETATLGVPTVLWNPLRGGHSVELERYDLLERVDSLEGLLAAMERLLSDPGTRERWMERRDRLLRDKEDFNARVLELLLQADG